MRLPGDAPPSTSTSNRADRIRLAEPEIYLADHADELVIVDEIHHAPGLFEPLRGVIDQGRREDRGTGRFLLLGSAGIDLLAQSGETLAGRIALVELAPFDVAEVGGNELDRLWIRGGFPDSFLAKTTRSASTAQTSSAPIWSATYRSSARGYPLRRCDDFGRCSPTVRGDRSNASQLAPGLGVALRPSAPTST